MAVYEVPPGYRIALFATMPRSGTWYSHYFVEFLDLFLTGRQEVRTRLDLLLYEGLKLGKLHTHCICPGFLEACRGEDRDLWEDLRFYTPGFDYGTATFIAGNLAVFSPLLSANIRIVYLYRNPLDQMVSFYRHIQDHRQDSTRSFIDAEGREIAFRDLGHFVRAGALEGYIKQYQTYDFMRRRGTPQVLMLPYEDLVERPDAAFRRILGHLDLPPIGGDLEGAFGKTLNATKPESLRNLERAMGSSLGRDQRDAGESHLRGGQIGKWRGPLSDDDVAYVEERLESAGLSLAGFVLDPDRPRGQAD